MAVSEPIVELETIVETNTPIRSTTGIQALISKLLKIDHQGTKNV